jgi:uncharacterized protein (TIGR03435 family)
VTIVVDSYQREAGAYMRYLTASSKVTLAQRALVLAALTAFAAVAQRSGTPLRFEVASVRRAEPDPKIQACLCEPPGRVGYRKAPIKWIIERAFDLQDSQIKGPGWLDDAIFNIDATLPEGAAKSDVPAMLRTLLEERFHLVVHVENTERPSFVLTVASGGTKLKPPPEDWEYSWRANKTGIHLRQRSIMKDFASYLSTQLEQPVVDETGLEGVFAVKLDFAPDSLLARAENRDDLAPPLPEALLQQLGLKLESRKRQLQTLVIDQIEKVPTAN